MTGPDGSEQFVKRHDFVSPRPRVIAGLLAAAVGLAGCGQPTSQASAPPPAPVTVAQPVKRTVTDWDEFTGRFEAVEEVQVRARVGGFVTSVEFRDGAIVHAGDLLYVIDSAPVRGGRAAGRRPACPMRAPRRSWPSANSTAR